MKLRFLSTSGSKPSQLLEAIAIARGCNTTAQIADFLDPHPLILNPIEQLPDYSKTIERLEQAIAHEQRIVVFGDYDCDGITALVQIYDLLQAAGHQNTAWFIPDRMTDDYGLTQNAAEKCLEQFQPHLIFCVDCGSPSHDSLTFLKSHGVDSIVLDHHTIEKSTSHPATAHLNPKACIFESEVISLLSEMSAAGLAFLFCERFSQKNRLQGWNRERALILAGLGTVADVMPLRHINRALVKHALLLANQTKILASIPGLYVLKQLTGNEQITAQTFGYQWGPRLNATGRVEEASHAVRLLLSKTIAEAEPLAQYCDQKNLQRQELQQMIETEALQQAALLLAQKNPPLLLLANKRWHPGVVGIVASRLKEKFHRPAIVCGWNEQGHWKGSGRSMDAYDLGEQIKAACLDGLLLKGGGHRLAAGLAALEHQWEPFCHWLLQNCGLTETDFQPEYEILHEVDGKVWSDAAILARRWHQLFQKLEPFGAGNGQPLLILKKAELRWGPKPKTKKNSNEIWAWSAGFTWSGKGLLFADWPDPEKPLLKWQPGGIYDLALLVSQGKKSETANSENSTFFYSWKVRDCERVEK